MSFPFSFPSPNAAVFSLKITKSWNWQDQRLHNGDGFLSISQLITSCRKKIYIYIYIYFSEVGGPPLSRMTPIIRRRRTPIKPYNLKKKKKKVGLAYSQRSWILDWVWTCHFYLLNNTSRKIHRDENRSNPITKPAVYFYPTLILQLIVSKKL